MIINNKVLNLLSFLFILIPLTLITGPFIPDLFLVIILLCSFYFFRNNRNFSFFDNSIFNFFLIFCLYILVVSILTNNFISIKSSIFYFRFDYLPFLQVI